MISSDAIGKVLRELPLQEQTIDVVAIQRMPDFAHLVVVDDRDVRMPGRRTDVTGIIVGLVDI